MEPGPAHLDADVFSQGGLGNSSIELDHFPLPFVPTNLQKVRQASWGKSYPEPCPPLVKAQGHVGLSEAWGVPE